MKAKLSIPAPRKINGRDRHARASSSWFLYIIRCADGSLYTGISTDVARRIEKHNAGKGASYTKGRGPVQLILQEGPLTESFARKCESAIKKLTRKEKEAFIEHRRSRSQ
jgi:putative endonuclease